VAYLYLPRRASDNSVCTVKSEQGMLIDFAADGRPIGIEITNPTSIFPDAINRVWAAIRRRF